MDRFFSF